jgi:opacity protein-like surface antigen
MTPRIVVLVAVGMLALTAPAAAFDANGTFKPGRVVLSVEGGWGEQSNFEDQDFETGLDFWNAGVRVGYLPFAPVLPGTVLHGSLEVGLEPFYQHYYHPHHAFFGGLGAVVRYHFLSLGRVVPYVELMGAAGGTDLKTREIDSTFTFLLHAGAGLEVFVTDRVALYGGYRLQHVSNGNTSKPNRGFESNGAAFGLSFFF